MRVGGFNIQDWNYPISMTLWGHNGSYSKKRLYIDWMISCQEAEHIEILEKWVWNIQIIQIYHFSK